MNTRTLLPAALLLLTSCATYQYAPNLPQMPLFREKGEARLAVGVGHDGSGDMSMLDVQASVAVTKGLAVQLNYGSFSGLNAGKYIELAAGHYRPVDGHGSFEVYGGAGYGTVSEVEDHDRHYYKLMAQPSFGYTSRNFEAAAGLRLAWLHHPGGEGVDGGAGGSTALAGADPVAGTRYLVEPAIMLRAGTSGFKVQLSYVGSENMGAPLNMIAQNLNVGLVFNLAHRAFPRP